MGKEQYQIRIKGMKYVHMKNDNVKSSQQNVTNNFYRAVENCQNLMQIF